MRSAARCGRDDGARAALRRLPPGRGAILILRAEGLAYALVSGALLWQSGPSFATVVIVLIAPDLTIAAYAAGPVIGAALYNAAHSTIGPLLLGGVGLFAGSRVTVEVALLWLAHIGVDRALGLGLKHRTGFEDTHLSDAGPGDSGSGGARRDDA